MTEGISSINGNVASNAYHFSNDSTINYNRQGNDTVTSNAEPAPLVQGSNNTVIMINGEDKNDPMQSLVDAVTELMKLNTALEVIGSGLDVSI